MPNILYKFKLKNFKKFWTITLEQSLTSEVMMICMYIDFDYISTPNAKIRELFKRYPNFVSINSFYEENPISGVNDMWFTLVLAQEDSQPKCNSIW